MTLTLDDITFSDFELPERIGAGGSQAVEIHKAIGGARVIDAMGHDDAPIEWTGRFLGETAELRALRLDLRRRGGKAVELAFGIRLYKVVVSRFTYEIEQPGFITYSIACEIIEDLIAGDGGASSETAAEKVMADLALAEARAEIRAALAVAASIASSVVRAAMGDKTVLRGIKNYALSEAMSVMGDSIKSALGDTMEANLAISAVRGVGGIVAGGDPTTMALGLVGSAAGAEGAYAGQIVGSALTRAMTNLGRGAP